MTVINILAYYNTEFIIMTMPLGLYYKTFYSKYLIPYSNKLVFFTSIYFPSNLIFACKARSLPVWSTLEDSILIVGAEACPQILDKGGNEWQLKTL